MIKISHLPTRPWIYQFKNKSWKILYVWKAKNIQKRVQQYFNNNLWVWKEDMISKTNHIDFIITQTEQEALILENNLIKKYQPRYNTLLKGDNSYTYIKITNENFPQILLTRFKDNDNSTYIWPKTYKHDLKKILQFLRQFFLFRWCWKTQFKKWQLCQDYTFWLCKWWCNKQIQQKNPSFQKLYKNNVFMITDFFNWKTENVEEKILWEIQKAIQNDNFERAAFLRDTYKNIQNYTQKQSIELSDPINGVFYKISLIQSWYVFVIIKFHRGKLIDIIRSKENSQDINFTKLKNKIEIEFGRMKTLKKTKDTRIGCSKKDLQQRKEHIDTNYSSIISLLDNSLESLILSTSMEKENMINEILSSLQTKYKLKNYPYSIECIDISHLSWDFVSAWLSSMSWGFLNKKWYRMYKISWLPKWKNDDYFALREVLIRRFKNSKKQLPDLFIIDWGKWQIWIISKLVTKDKFFEDIFKKVDFVSIWKWQARKISNKRIWAKEKLFFLNNQWKTYSKELNYDEADKMLIKIRDEAHRFANRYRKIQMSKKWK